MLGPAFSFKCLLSPVVKFHLFKTYTCLFPRSGLSSSSRRTNTLMPLTIFHRKTLRVILCLSKKSNIPALYFLLGELPIEAQIHEDIFSLFFSVWRNSDSKIYQILGNSQMSNLNVSTTRLRGRRRPALSEFITSVDVKNSRIHPKM